jgi:transposase
MTVREARIIINFYKLGHSIETINYMTGHSIETIKDVIEGIKR